MHRLAWLTDLHLNFLRPGAAEAFCASLAPTEADAFLLSGDIGEADTVARYLTMLDRHLRRPLYFVLGNHDFYGGSFEEVHEQVRQACEAYPGLVWLPDAGVVALTESTCLVGHDGWGDGREGEYATSAVQLSDWELIEDLAGLTRKERLRMLNALGDEAADHFASVLPKALKEFRHVVVLTHVPPFREACWHQGRISDDDYLPHFTCKAAGEVLRECMAFRPDRRMTVLCGHSHGGGEAQILPNLRALTGEAAYGRPQLQRVVEVG